MLTLIKPSTLITLLFLGIASGLAYRAGKDRLAVSVYRDRLEQLHTDYNALANQYNQAVTRSAVTELDVTSTTVTVTVRTPAGVLQSFPTPYNPQGEIFLDYVVLDGRLWIRRVFDEHTPPNQGVVINPDLAHIDWNNPDADHGKAAYRSLTPGRWRLSVSGDGALTLRPAPTNASLESLDLATAPEVHDYDPVATANAEIDDISFTDILGQLFSR
ncbi:MAG: hypothetical protein RIG82_09855 [Phycisphaeraceae bacterium]